MVLSGAYQTAETHGAMLVSNDPEGREHAVKWLKHAFAIDSPEQIKPSETQRALVEKLCAEVVRRRLTTPALFILEMSRPLNFVSAQFLHFLHPFVTVIVDKNEYEHLTLFLEQRGSIDYICRHLEALEAEYGVRERAGGNKSTPEGAGLQSRERHDKD